MAESLNFAPTKKMEKVRTYIIADNQELTGKGFEAIIKSVDGNSSVLFAHDKSKLIALLSDHQQSVVVMDFSLFDFADEDSLLLLSERFAETVWLLIGDELPATVIHKMVYASQKFGFIFKNSSLSVIKDALRTAAGGRRYVCQMAMEKILEQGALVEDTEILTATELSVLRTIAQGKTTKEIAAERSCSIHTINAHRKNIFRKLNVNTAHEAVKYAFRSGLVNPAEFYG